MSRFPTMLVMMLAAVLPAGRVEALTPAQVLVVANAASRPSVELARYYARARRIPARNVAIIKTTTASDVSRDEFDRQIRRPIAKLLLERKLATSIRCIALMWGVPLRVTGSSASAPPSRPYAQAAARTAKPTAAKPTNKHLATPNASVDSELSLLWWGSYSLPGPKVNLLSWRQAAGLRGTSRPPSLMTSRLDGPSHKDAARMLRDSLAAEARGLGGTFYIDAGGPERLKTVAARYDAGLKGLAAFVRSNSRFDVILDEKPAVFAAGTCPNAALYVGWYSLRKYVPAFKWTTGSVGYHVASFEAAHLRNAESNEWCPRMIRGGIAATIGAVQEPLLSAFPSASSFFSLLLTGKWTIAECYWRTVPMASWQMTLIADPLYNPFAASPQVPVEALRPGLAPRPAATRPASARLRLRDRPTNALP